ncbi:hypothetical protein [Paenibacillus sp. 481]|uniref:hypothetical protein n=1 Tax=Paenibacillus sp. 481 TaxID=2835869 RepID=UPI001E2A2A07|nr:hypothetical protein [Paenibacillus sp. 481]UHA73744.1 hypothetical protein KIK04_00790 [Paenibacillus sp. 481]
MKSKVILFTIMISLLGLLTATLTPTKTKLERSDASKPSINTTTSNKTWHEVKPYFREVPKAEARYEVSNLITIDYPLANRRSEPYGESTLHHQFATVAQFTKTPFWRDDEVVFKGESRGFWDTPPAYANYPITLARSDQFGITYLGSSARFHVTPTPVPTTDVTITAGDKEVTLTYAQTNRNYSASSYSQIHAKAYKITSVNQTSSTTVLYGVSTIMTSVSDSRSVYH